MGYKGEISQEVEKILVNDPEKKLKRSLISTKNAHLGENMHYKVISKSEDDDFEGERERFRARKEEQKRKRLARMGYDNWTPWDGKSLESVATRETS
jgi:hypothetical protein